VPEGWRREFLIPKRRGQMVFVREGQTSSSPRVTFSRSEKRRRAELQSAFVRELVDNAWRGGKPSMGVQKREYLKSVSSTGHERQFSSWVADRKRALTKPLYRFMAFLRDGALVRPVPRVSGVAVRRWLSEGLPSDTPRAGVGAKANSVVRDWVPMVQKEEDPCEWRDVVPWEGVFGHASYQHFILGVPQPASYPPCTVN
jgi:hypothetical protein